MNKFTLYSTSTCSNCKIVKKILETYEVPFEEKYIDLNEEFNEELNSITNGQRYVPTLVVDGSIFVSIKPHEALELVKRLRNNN